MATVVFGDRLSLDESRPAKQTRQDLQPIKSPNPEGQSRNTASWADGQAIPVLRFAIGTCFSR